MASDTAKVLDLTQRIRDTQGEDSGALPCPDLPPDFNFSVADGRVLWSFFEILNQINERERIVE